MKQLHRAAKPDGVSDFGARKLPRIGESQPVFGIFVLPAVLDRLAEQTVIVADAVAICGDLQRRHAFHKAGRKPPQAAVAKRCVGLHLGEFFKIDVKAGERFTELSGKAEIVQRVHEQTADQKLQRQVVDAPPAFLVIRSFGCDPGLDDLVARDESGRDEPIALDSPLSELCPLSQ